MKEKTLTLKLIEKRLDLDNLTVKNLVKIKTPIGCHSEKIEFLVYEGSLNGEYSFMIRDDRHIRSFRLNKRNIEFDSKDGALLLNLNLTPYTMYLHNSKEYKQKDKLLRRLGF